VVVNVEEFTAALAIAAIDAETSLPVGAALDGMDAGDEGAVGEGEEGEEGGKTGSGAGDDAVGLLIGAGDDLRDDADDGVLLMDPPSTKTSGCRNDSAASINSTVMIIPPASTVDCTVPVTMTRSSR